MTRFVCRLFVIVTGCLFVASACGQVPQNIFERVLNVRVNSGTPKLEYGTAFTIDVDGREYVITAKHVVAGLGDENTIDVFSNNDWKPLHVKIFRCDDPIDIAVVIPPYQLTVNFPVSTEGNVQFGQDAYFLGFPYGIQTPSQGANGPYPFPLIKRGTLSSMIPLDRAKGQTRIFLDGYNNPGFSGGPIAYRDFNEAGYVMKVIGVISGFIPDVVATMKEHDIASPEAAGEKAKAEPWRIRRRANGKWFEYVDNDSFVALNTGIVDGFGIQPAVDLIRQHPIGPETKDLPGNNPVAPN